MPTASTISLVTIAVILVILSAIKFGPEIMGLLKRPTTDVFTRHRHDELCQARLGTVASRLLTIEDRMGKDKIDAERHEKEVKDTMGELWKRLDTVSDTMNKNHFELMKEIKIK